MSTVEKISEKLDEIAARSRKRRDVGQLVDSLREAVATITHLDPPPARMTPRERSKFANDSLERIAHLLGLRN